MRRSDRLNRIPRNPIERQCWEALTRQGYRPVRRGWPDLAVISPKGELGMIKLSGKRGYRLKTLQTEIMALLAKHGVRTFTYSPTDGFKELIQPQPEINL